MLLIASDARVLLTQLTERLLAAGNEFLQSIDICACPLDVGRGELISDRFNPCQVGLQQFELRGEFFTPGDVRDSGAIDLLELNRLQNLFVDLADQLAEIGDFVLQRHDRRVQQIELVEQRILDRHAQVRG